MAAGFDMNADYDVVAEIENSLRNISNALEVINQSMIDMVVNGGEALEGKRYQKIVNETKKCVQVNDVTISNIRNAIEYTGEIERHLMEYSKLKFN